MSYGIFDFFKDLYKNKYLYRNGVDIFTDANPRLKRRRKKKKNRRRAGITVILI